MDENTETFKEQLSNSVDCSAKTINAPVVGQLFGSWEELD
ncbi:23811_t:CDS:2 [Dentiscutata erythropus]|uniref:23811_t:CDS:1 n=1 Tax=Dentiscutata erythropus TaxID=1348616 RepID=A0A9N9H6K8_9GLOM|nr:23811_t:CDS:2 [Dentiscutata erythropus]